MYRPSQTPRLAVSSNRITREHVSAIDARPAREGGSRPHATLRAWLENTVTAAAKADGARVPPHRSHEMDQDPTSLYTFRDISRHGSSNNYSTPGRALRRGETCPSDLPGLPATGWKNCKAESSAEETELSRVAKVATRPRGTARRCPPGSFLLETTGGGGLPALPPQDDALRLAC
ncbi:hypothetical protein Trydic_g12044 [Trypoxylus dichotomus]